MLQQSSSIACHPGQEGTRNCNYGRLCGSLSIGGRDVGNILISEGLAHPYICGATSCPPPAPVVLSQGSPERLFRRLRNAVLTRSRFLAVETQVPDLTDDQRDALRTALTDALADLSGYKAEPAPDDDDSLEEDELEREPVPQICTGR
jgi:hypothetical protein